LNSGCRLIVRIGAIGLYFYTARCYLIAGCINLENQSTGNQKNGTSSGDTINVGDIKDSNGVIIGTKISIGSININSLKKQLEKIPNEYSKSLETFSEELNKEFKLHNTPQQKASQIQESVIALGKEVEGISLDEQKDVDYMKRTKVEAQTADLVNKILDALPSLAETALSFTPLNPFSKLFGKGIEQVVKAVKEYRSKSRS
jgi:hypothetical protein